MMQTPEVETSVTGSLRFIWRQLSSARRRHFLMAMGVMLLGAVAELVTIGSVLPFLALIADPSRAADVPMLGSLFGALGIESGRDAVMVAAGILIAAALFSAAVRLALTWTTLRFILELGHDVGIIVFARMLRQPYRYYVTRNSSELLASVEKVQTVIWAVLMPAMQAVIGGVISLAIIGLLIAIDPSTAIIAAVAMSATYLGVSLAVRNRLHRNSKRLAAAASLRLQTIQEGLGGIRDLLLEQSQPVFEEKYRKVDREYRWAQAVNNLIAFGPRYIVESTGIVLIAVLAVYMSGQPGGIVAAIPILGALALGAQRLLPLLQQTYNGWSAFAGNRQMLFDVVGLMRAPVVATLPRSKHEPVAPFRREVRLVDVGFDYVGRHQALSGVNLAIAKGARVGLVGETGSGKSTLMDVIMGLLEPTSGEIQVDGVAMTDATRSSWQAQIAHVPQTIFLSDGSVAANIAFGEAVGEIDLERVREAARLAQIDPFILDLPEGYDTPVGERGIRLSGGQRQRIGIARALFKRAPVLVFDEATSALDDATEAAVMEAIASLGEDVTLLMIAHRVSTLRGCSQIVRLAGGRVAEVGSYDEVIGPRRGRSRA
jgi:ABC-type multidrug transport system fused ATPase/permease subunit